MTDTPLTREEALDALDALVAAFRATDTETYFATMASDATFLFHPEPSVIGSAARYREAWEGWLAAGWQVTGCTSTDRQVTLAGPVAVVTHRVRTDVHTPDGPESLDERETVVLARRDGRVLVVHEHLSPTPSAAQES